MPNFGVEQTREVIRAIGTLGAAIRVAAADGIDSTDLLGLITDPAVRDALMDAVRGMAEIPQELADLNLREMGDLSNEVFAMLATISEAGSTDAGVPADAA